MTNLCVTSCALLVAGCVEPVAETSSPDIAIDQFWQTFKAGDLGGLPEAQSVLASAFDDNPDDGNLATLLGMSHMWNVAEGRFTGVTVDEQRDGITQAIEYTNRAVLIGPNNSSWWGYLGGNMVAAGIFGSDPAFRAQGRWVLDTYVYPYDPVFASLTVRDTSAQLPIADPGFQDGLDQAWASLEMCVGHPLDRAAPDLSDLGNLAARPELAMCWNHFKATHTEEGGLLIFGDMLVKNRQPSVARAMYTAAMSRPTFATWRFRAIVESRLTDDLEARAAAYYDDDRSNDPPIGTAPAVCANCHAD